MKKAKTRKPGVAGKPTRARTQPQPPPQSARLEHFQSRQSLIVETIRQMVEMESPSDNKAAVDKLGRWLASKFEALGGHSKFHRTVDFGDHLQVDFSGRDRRRPVLLLGHIDTVYPLGTLASMPCRRGVSCSKLRQRKRTCLSGWSGPIWRRPNPHPPSEQGRLQLYARNARTSSSHSCSSVTFDGAVPQRLYQYSAFD